MPIGTFVSCVKKKKNPLEWNNHSHLALKWLGVETAVQIFSMNIVLIEIKLDCEIQQRYKTCLHMVPERPPNGFRMHYRIYLKLIQMIKVESEMCNVRKTITYKGWEGVEHCNRRLYLNAAVA